MQDSLERMHAERLELDHSISRADGRCLHRVRMGGLQEHNIKFHQLRNDECKCTDFVLDLCLPGESAPDAWPEELASVLGWW